MGIFEFGDGFKVTLFRKVSSASEKVSSAPEKVSSAPEKVSSAPEKVSSAFEQYLSLFDEAEITATFVSNIQKVFDVCGTNMPFRQADNG